jgi:hypothetical protein
VQHRRVHRKRSQPRLGPVVELTYPEGTLQALAELIDSDRRVPLDSELQRLRSNLDAKKPSRLRLTVGEIHRMEEERRERLALAHAWRKRTRTQVPPGHVVILLDGDPENPRTEDLYCLPRHLLASWMRIVRTPMEAHVAALEEEIMTLRTSEDVKKKLLDVLDQLVDTTKPPDYLRQRAICETVQTLVGMLKVEVAYIRAIDGDGLVPFLEPAREEAKARRETAGRRTPLLGGPSPGHPWRGLGSRDK